MEPLTFASVADDDTGASDLAGMLADQDVRTLLVIDLPETDRLLEWSRGCQAVVMAEGTRSIDPHLAYERTREAIRLLEPLAPRVLQIKYCSTFDSSPAGNIGPTIDAALDELGEDFTIVVPALPVNGRTTYMGYHFVHRQLLSDSPMRHHPLTPMTNPNLVDFLGRQTRRKVGLAAYPVVEAGAGRLREQFEELRRQGTAMAVVDCLNDVHLETICRASADLRLLTGSSALGIKMPAIWREKGWLREETGRRLAPPAPDASRGCLVVAGSCSVATREQNAWLVAHGGHSIQLDPRELVSGSLDQAAVTGEAGRELRAGRPCLIATSAMPEEVRVAQEWARGQGMTTEELGLRLVRAVAEMTAAILGKHPVAGLLTAGGETSGAICRKLRLGALRVGANIDPGVPLCYSLGEHRFPVVLKSGNFGSHDFYGKALRAIMHADDPVWKL